VAPDWLPGDPGDDAAALVGRVTALIGTIDAATAELVRLHLAVGEPELSAEALAVLAGAMAELEQDVDPGHQVGPGHQ
jgi:hypothetical protein